LVSWEYEVDKAKTIKKTKSPNQENMGMGGLAMVPPSVKEFWLIV
jgi:hypothetical protein